MYSIESMIGRRFHSLTVLRLTPGTVARTQAATFVDARCDCTKERERVCLKSLIDGSVKACRACAEGNRRNKIGHRRRSRKGLNNVTARNYKKHLARLPRREREEVARIMLRHGHCSECASNTCVSDAVLVVMADRGKPQASEDVSYLYERRDFRHWHRG